jgi:hypothetical protein
VRTVVPITEVRRNFGVFHDIALAAPVPVSKHGHASVYIVSARLYEHVICLLESAGIAADFLTPAVALTPASDELLRRE